MRQKNKQIKIKGIIKNLRYYIIWLKNIFKYRNKKVGISFLEVWVGQSCTLKCRDCLHMIPYVSPEIYDVDKLISDCKKIFEMCEVDFFSIVGGEPFTNKNLYKLLDFVGSCDNIKDGKLITNGSVMPDEKTMLSIIGLKNKLDVRIDAYPEGEKRAEKFYEKMKFNNVRCTFMRHSVWAEMRWKWLGGERQPLIDSKTSGMLYRGCALKACHTMAKGEFTVCPRGITTEAVFGLKKNKFEHVDITHSHNNCFVRGKIATSIDYRIGKDYCRFCLSISADNPFSVNPGIQMNGEIKNERYVQV